MNNILLLICAHAIADSSLQTDRMASLKGMVLRYMLSHCFVYAGIVSMMLMVIGRYEMWKLIWLFSTHFTIDQGLSYYKKDPQKLGWIGWLDQGLHLLALGVCLI